MWWTLLLAAQAAPPHESYPRLVTANGVGVVGFGAEGLREDGASYGVLDRFSDHLYQVPAPGAEPTRDLLYDSYFGLTVGEDGGTWLSTASDYGYTEVSPHLRVTRPHDTLQLTEHVVAPMGLALPVYLHVLEVHNPGASAVADVQVHALYNFHLGSDDGTGANTRDEALEGSLSRIVEEGSTTGLAMGIWPLEAPSEVGCESVYQGVLDGAAFAGSCSSAGDDRVGAYTWSLGTLEPGETRLVASVQGFHLAGGTDALEAELLAWVAERSVEELLAAEGQWWTDWLAQGVAPEVVPTAEEQAVYDQALIFLKMAQVREEGAPFGQIPASLPASAAVGGFSHEWNITWVRDGAYAIRALAAAGYTEEARDALAFQIQEGRSGTYSSWIGDVDYAVSVCRYYGDGTEESDADADGPNIEFDNWGLYLWAVAGYIEASGDEAFLVDHGAAIFDGTADALVAMVDEELDLISADSSIWERHWNGKQKHFTYTTAWAVRGLRDAAWMAEAVGDPRAEGYREVADRLAAGMRAHLVGDDDVLVGNLEEHLSGQPAMDLAAVDAFNNGALDNLGEAAFASFAAWEATLLAGEGPGYIRNDDGDLYDLQEWIMVDLRLAQALRRACMVEEAQELEEHVLDNALANNLIIPELLDPDAGDYAGPAPMLGFGSGMWVLTLHQRAEAAADCAAGPDEEDGGDEGGGDEEGGEDGEPADDTGAREDPDASGGCGCSGGGSAALVLLLLPWLTRRR